MAPVTCAKNRTEQNRTENIVVKSIAIAIATNFMMKLERWPVEIMCS